VDRACASSFFFLSLRFSPSLTFSSSSRLQIKSLASSQLPTCSAASRSPLDNLSLAELTDQHVRDTVQAVSESDIVRAAWDEGREVSVHGWVYHVATAKLRDLDCGYKGGASLSFPLSSSRRSRDAEQAVADTTLVFCARSGRPRRLALAPGDLRRQRAARRLDARATSIAFLVLSFSRFV